MAKRDAIALVIDRLPPPGKKSGGGGAPAREKDEDSDNLGEVSAVEDFMAAVKKGDAEVAAEALADFVRICTSKYED